MVVLDSYQLQIFLAVVESGSYTAAARRLHLTQPAVSRQMRLLQKQLGVSLLRRAGRRMVPTHAGERLAEVSRQVLDMSRQVEQEMALLRGETVGVLRVGGSGAPAWYVLGRLAAPFRAAFPGIGLQLRPLPPEGAGRALREGRLDLALAEEEISERGLACDLVMGMECLLVVPPDEQWSQRKRMPLRKLPEVPLILPAHDTPARSFLEERLVAQGIGLTSTVPALEVADPGAALPLVAAGLGAALLPQPLLEGHAPTVHPVTLWPGISWPIYLVRRSPPVDALVDMFCQFTLGKRKVPQR